MNLEEASKHPDRLAKEAADAAYSSLHHIHEIVARQYSNELNDDQKLHVVSALEEACKAYKAARAAESVIVNSDFFPDDEAVAPDTSEDIPEPDEQDEPDDVFVYSYVLTHGYAYKMNSIDHVAMKFVAPVELSVNAEGVKRACSVVGLETLNEMDKDDGDDVPCVYALVLYVDTPESDCTFHKPLSEFSAHDKEQLIHMMLKGNSGRFDDYLIGADPDPKEDETHMVEDEAFVSSYIRAQGSMYDTSIAVKFSHPVVVFARPPLGEKAPAYSVVGLGVTKSRYGGVFAIVAKDSGYDLLIFTAFPDDSQRKLIGVMKQGNSGLFCKKIEDLL